jgi:TPR repeat protein
VPKEWKIMAKHHPDPAEKRREAVRELRLAEQGETAAQNSLGARLAQGYFATKDLAGALYWYVQAVRQGYTHAKWNAGSMLVAGEGGAAHLELGMQLIEQAAHSGEVSACNFLSHCYAQGAFGKHRDPDKSNFWASRAQVHERFAEYGDPVDVEAHGVTLAKPTIEWR